MLVLSPAPVACDLHRLNPDLAVIASADSGTTRRGSASPEPAALTSIGHARTAMTAAEAAVLKDPRRLFDSGSEEQAADASVSSSRERVHGPHDEDVVA